jgi:GAF domain-containing protein
MGDSISPSGDAPPPARVRSVREGAAGGAGLDQSLIYLAQLAAASLPIRTMLTKVAEYAVLAIPGAEGGGLTLIAEDGAETLVYTTQFVSDVDAIQYGLRQGPCLTAASEGLTVLSNSLGEDERWPQFGPQVVGLGVHSALSLPLIRPDRLVGTLNIYARQRNAFSSRSADLGQQFAVPAAIAVRDSHVLHYVREAATRLETALATRAVIDQAIGILIDSAGVSSKEAERRLRAASQATQRVLRDVAQDVLAEVERRNQQAASDEPESPA